MGAAREPGQADFDLERFIDMFDEALTSTDERVVNALRSLMMMVILTKSETPDTLSDRKHGPLRQLVDDVNHINRRMHQMEEAMREIQHTRYKQEAYKWDDLKKYSMQDVYHTNTFHDQLHDALQKINGGYHQTNAVSKTKVPK